MPLPKLEPLDLQEIRTPFGDAEWLEVKYDGFRALAAFIVGAAMANWCQARVG